MFCAFCLHSGDCEQRKELEKLGKDPKDYCRKRRLRWRWLRRFRRKRDVRRTRPAIIFSPQAPRETLTDPDIKPVKDEGKYTLVRIRTEDLPNLKIQKVYRRILLDRYMRHGFSKRAHDRDLQPEAEQGNIVLAYSGRDILMLDPDLKRKTEVIPFSEEYAKFHDLGSSAVFLSSDPLLVDLFGVRLYNFAVIFGKRLSNQEIQWHLKECLRLGMVDRAFAEVQTDIRTIRVNAKNKLIPPPVPVHYFRNGDDTGIQDFVTHWVRERNLGLKDIDPEELTEERLDEIEEEIEREVRTWLEKYGSSSWQS